MTPSATALASTRPVTAEEAQHYIDTLRDAVTLRLQAGAHPDDAMLTAATLLDAWIAVHVDGAATSVYGDGVPSRYRLEHALEQIAAGKRPDGSYNLSREACEQIARKALGDV